MIVRAFGYCIGSSTPCHRKRLPIEKDFLMTLNQKVSGKFGVAGVKAAMDIAGFYGGPPRSSLLPLTPDERKKLHEDLLGSGLFTG
jgi:dihydrodipicolinate synthase/N-acetylneuraminate lyase